MKAVVKQRPGSKWSSYEKLAPDTPRLPGTYSRGSIISPHSFIGGQLQPVALVGAYRATKNIDYLKKAYLAMGNALYLFTRKSLGKVTNLKQITIFSLLK